MVLTGVSQGEWGRRRERERGRERKEREGGRMRELIIQSKPGGKA